MMFQMILINEYDLSYTKIIKNKLRRLVKNNYFVNSEKITVLFQI